MVATAEEGKAGKPEMPFQQTPNDLLMACMTRGSVTQRACLAAMLASNYGATNQLADIDRKAISRATGATPQAVRIALCRLVKENVVIRSEDGYRVNPRYWQWEAMDPEQAKEYRRLGRHRKAFPARNKAFPTRNDAPQEAFPHGNGAFLPGNEAFPARNEAFPPRNAPLKREEIYTRETLSQSACETPANSTRSFPDPLPAKAAQGIDYHPDATPEVRAELIAAADKYRGWGPDCSKALGERADPEHVKAALKRAEEVGAYSWGFVVKALADYKRFGVPKPKPKPGSREARDELLARIQANCKAYEERERAERLAARGAVA